MKVGGSRPKLHIISRQINNCSNVDSVAERQPKFNILANISVRDIRDIDYA